MVAYVNVYEHARGACSKGPGSVGWTEWHGSGLWLSDCPSGMEPAALLGTLKC